MAAELRVVRKVHSMFRVGGKSRHWCLGVDEKPRFRLRQGKKRKRQQEVVFTPLGDGWRKCC